MEKLVIAGREFNSRLFLGTGKFNNNQLMAEAIKASETEMVTVAMKRIELEDKQDDLLSHIVQNPNIQLLPNTSVPVVVDAGIGAPSHAAEAMEMGASACLVNTAIAVAGDPVEMAKAFKEAVVCGRRAYEAGLGAISDCAEASSPLTAFLND